MPTDDERREVAARLREFEQLRAAFKDSNICAFSDALGVGYMDWEHICARLADLIEPRTCRDVYDGREFRCSACGSMSHVLERDEAWEWRFVGAPRFCPHCGAEVVADA